MAARFSYGVAAHPGWAARASAAARRTSTAAALPTRVIVAPVAGSTTSIDPPAAARHSAPNRRPRHVDSIMNFGTGAFISIPRLFCAYKVGHDKLAALALRSLYTTGCNDAMPSRRNEWATLIEGR